jgi:E3 SUMO-protein ligase PIAS1
VFKKSPFYETRQLIGTVHPLQIMPNHKNSATINIASRYLIQCQADDSLRIMLFAAKGTHGAQDIAFPQQSDVRVDHVEVKGLNMRGLKNKPGTTRPADLTTALLSRGVYDKAIEFVYALTNEVHYLAAYLCKATSVEQLVTRIAAGNKISKDSVLHEFNDRPQDADELMATSQVLSLKCPLSWVRLSLPCRSMSCSHNQCFDATSYLQLQQQGPQWLCPVCNKSAPFDQLAVDEYVKDILLRTSPSVEQVAIDPNGRWTIPSSTPSADRKRKALPQIKQDDDDDDDIAEIIALGSNPIRTLSAPRASISRDPQSQLLRETPVSTSTPTPRSATSNKRPASQPAIIDLTLSSDEDNEPIARPSKRPYLGR